MAPTTPSVVPSQIRAGDTVRFTRAYPDFPAGDGWVATCTLAGEGKLATEATASGNDFLFAFAPADTAGLAPGTYRYAITALLSGARYTVEEGWLEVTPDVAVATAGALQSHDEKVLRLLEAELEARAASDHTEYSIDGRSLKRETIETLTAWANRMRARIARKKRGSLPMVAVTFTRPGSAA